MFAAVAGEQQPQTKTYHANNRQHFWYPARTRIPFRHHTDERSQIYGINDNKKRRRPYPYLVHPGSQYCIYRCRRGANRHPDQHKHDPMVPARQKTRKRLIFRAKWAEAGRKLKLFGNAQLARIMRKR